MPQMRRAGQGGGKDGPRLAPTIFPMPLIPLSDCGP
jgi:hypothetical protein